MDETVFKVGDIKTIFKDCQTELKEEGLGILVEYKGFTLPFVNEATDDTVYATEKWVVQWLEHPRLPKFTHSLRELRYKVTSYDRFSEDTGDTFE